MSDTQQAAATKPGWPYVSSIDPRTIKLHPAVISMPELADDDPRYLALVASIRERGMDYPVILDSQNRLVDGRHRRRAAINAGVDQIPARRCGDAEIAAIIIESLVARRHFTKGALAYLAYPLLKTALEERRENGIKIRSKNLKNNTNSRNTTESATESEKGHDPAILTVNPQELFQRWGFCRDLLRMADTLHNKFEESPGLRPEWEAKILSGETGLGAAIAGIAGMEETKGKKKGSGGDNRTVTLLKEAATALQLRFRYFDDIAPAKRVEEAASIADAIVTSAPPEVIKALKRRLKEITEEKE